MKKAAIIVLGLLSVPTFAFINAAIYSIVWSMTLAADYGAGPSYQGWCGVSALTGLLTFGLMHKQDKDDESNTWQAVVGRQAGFYILVGIVLLSLGALRAAMGWH